MMIINVIIKNKERKERSLGMKIVCITELREAPYRCELVVYEDAGSIFYFLRHAFGETENVGAFDTLEQAIADALLFTLEA